MSSHYHVTIFLVLLGLGITAPANQGAIWSSWVLRQHIVDREWNRASLPHHKCTEDSRHLDCYVTYKAVWLGQRDNVATTSMKGEVGTVQILSSVSWQIYLVYMSILFCGELQLLRIQSFVSSSRKLIIAHGSRPGKFSPINYYVDGILWCNI